MCRLPRIGVGSLDPATDARPMVWALLDLLTGAGLSVQHFTSRACFSPIDAATPVTGQGTRHLDSWLMSVDVCRALFFRGSLGCDLAIVETDCANRQAAIPANLAREGSAHSSDTACRAGFDELCRWLELPRVAVLDVARLGRCRLPQRPSDFDALLLDCVEGDGAFLEHQTRLESLWGIPVIGGLPAIPRLRRELMQLPSGTALPRVLASELGRRLHAGLDLARLRVLADTRPFAYEQSVAALGLPEVAGFADAHHIGLPEALWPRDRALRIALAYDAAFSCYFPDTLDLLDVCGATIVDFSPLKDESLPPDTDVVYLGCGHPERFAAELASNQCMFASLRNHQRAGKRVYAEGGGMAYACRSLDSGRASSPMAGLLPAVARRRPDLAGPAPVEFTLAEDCWLAGKGTTMRGYRGSGWTVTIDADVKPCNGRTLVQEPENQQDFLGARGVLGSRVHLNFAAQPTMMRHFFAPHAITS